MEKTLAGKKIAIIIAFRDFRDEEYFIPKKILEMSGAETNTASTAIGQAIGKFGAETEATMLINDIKVLKYDAIVFVGGPGAGKLIDDTSCHRIAKEAAEKGKILAAICIAPAILAKSGVLKGKKATVWSSSLDKSAIKILKEAGADYQDESVVIDGRIITANNPDAGQEFAQKIIELLK